MARDHVENTGCLIGGMWTATAETLPVEAPSDGSEIGRIASGGADHIDAAVGAARTALQGDWGRSTAVERGRILHAIGQAIAAEHEELARLEALDTGKPLSQARVDVTCAARYFEYYGAAADKVHGDSIPFLNGYQVMTVHEPHGVTGHIIPWNYPVQMIGRSCAAALAMGNACVLKPAEEASLTALRLGQIALDCGLPSGALNVVPGLGETAGAALTAHPDVNFLSFTGSPEVGALVQAAAAQNHIGCTLELGGKSPQIVFADADLDTAVATILKAIVQNGGQTCSAGSRVLVEQAVHGEVTDRLAERFKTLTAGAWDADLDLGALISARQKARVERYIEAAGAPLARGRIDANAPENGHYVAPALYASVAESDPLAKEEVFGPVLAVLPFSDEADAIRIANDTPYGLVAGVWTRDGGRQMRMAKAVRAGQVFVNGYGAGGGIELPFGGTGRSGHGREKGFVALHEFSAVKTIVLNHGE